MSEAAVVLKYYVVVRQGETVRFRLHQLGPRIQRSYAPYLNYSLGGDSSYFPVLAPAESIFNKPST